MEKDYMKKMPVNGVRWKALGQLESVILLTP